MINNAPTVVVMGHHCNGYGIRSLPVPPDQAKAMAVLAKRHPGHPGCFWEFNFDDNTWTSEVKFRRKSELYCLAEDFDPNTHIVLTMLVDPHSADFGQHRAMSKKKFEASFGAAQPGFVVVNLESGELWNGGNAKLEPWDVFFACMPHTASDGLLYCEVCTGSSSVGACLKEPVSTMRLAVARLQGWPLSETDVMLDQTKVKDSDGVTLGEKIEKISFVRVEGQ